MAARVLLIIGGVRALTTLLCASFVRRSPLPEVAWDLLLSSVPCVQKLLICPTAPHGIALHRGPVITPPRSATFIVVVVQKAGKAEPESSVLGAGRAQYGPSRVPPLLRGRFGGGV